MRYIYFIFALFIGKLSAGQPASYVKNLGSAQLISYAHGVYQSSGGSIYLGGYGDDALYSLITFTKLDAYGNEEFTRYYGDSLHHYMMMRMLALDDNSFLLVGSKMVHGGNNFPLAIKVDSTGAVIWEYSNSLNSNAWFTGVSTFQDGNLVFTGAATDTANGDLNLYGIITDASGNFLHTFNFGDVGINETAENCVVTSDGTILICGDRPLNLSTVNPYVAAFDSTGNYLWDLSISSHLNSGSKNLFIDFNNDLLVVGESATNTSQQFDIQLSKINVGASNLIWSKMIPGTDMSDAGFALSETIDGNYAIAGYSHDSTTATKRIVLILTDTAGTELSKKYFGSSPINIGYDIQPSVYGGFLIAGADFVNNQKVLVYQKESGIGIEEIDRSVNAVFPNPFCSNSILHFTRPVDQIIVYDVSGKQLFSKVFKEQTFVSSFPTLNSGVYIVTSFYKGKSYQSPLIVTE